MHNMISKLVELRNTLVSLFVQREREITAVLSGLISGEPVILVGPPGTAKTKLIDTLAKMINAKYFYYLLTRFTEPDELLGPVDIQALRQGIYRRITTNRLPEAEIVFLDEIFKASSAVRNLLLDIILNKRYLNGTEYRKLPMLTLYTASNEVSSDAEDMAFYDRLTIRAFVRNVSSDKWDELLTKGIELSLDGFKLKPIMSVDDVRRLQGIVEERAKAVVRDKPLINKYIEALGELRNKGIEVSDRRKIKTLIVAAAISVIYMDSKVTLDSLAEAIVFTAVHNEDDVRKVEEIILKVGLSAYHEQIQKIQMMEAELREIFNNVRSKTEPSTHDLKVLSRTAKKVYAEIKKMPRDPKLKPHVDRVIALLEEVGMYLEKMRREILGD